MSLACDAIALGSNQVEVEEEVEVYTNGDIGYTSLY
jgi:hypothetical protein